MARAEGPGKPAGGQCRFAGSTRPADGRYTPAEAWLTRRGSRSPGFWFLGTALASHFGSLGKMRKPPPRRDSPAAMRRRVLRWLEGRTNYERVPAPRAPASGFGLARMRRLLAELGNPERRFPVAHVAGTKGKGSTVAMLAEILHESGYTVGRYMSPHVNRIEERIWVGGRLIAGADFVAACDRVIPAVEQLDLRYRRRGLRGPTWFEVVTAAAFVHFARIGVDIAVLETGLGGRLDATNVSHPLVSVITSISLDHMALLGDTVAAIAGEKAGIMKPRCPVVSGALHPDARRVIAGVAARRRAPLLQLSRDFLVAESGGADTPRQIEIVVPAAAGATARRRYELAMLGRHQADNAALAVVATDVLARRGFPVADRAIAAGLARVRLPARIERVAERPLVICDAAHNVASMQALLEALGPLLASRRPRALVFAASADKQVEEMLACARGSFDHVVVTRYLSNPRACDTDRLREACRRGGLPRPRIAAHPAEALRLARSAVGKEGVVVAAGSFFLAGEIAAAVRLGS